MIHGIKISHKSYVIYCLKIDFWGDIFVVNIYLVVRTYMFCLRPFQPLDKPQPSPRRPSESRSAVWSYVELD